MQRAERINKPVIVCPIKAPTAFYPRP